MCQPDVRLASPMNPFYLSFKLVIELSFWAHICRNLKNLGISIFLDITELSAWVG